MDADSRRSCGRILPEGRFTFPATRRTAVFPRSVAVGGTVIVRRARTTDPGRYRSSSSDPRDGRRYPFGQPIRPRSWASIRPPTPAWCGGVMGRVSENREWAPCPRPSMSATDRLRRHPATLFRSSLFRSGPAATGRPVRVSWTGALCPCTKAQCGVFGLDPAPSHRLARPARPSWVHRTGQTPQERICLHQCYTSLHTCVRRILGHV